jgi:hypothetical protein
MRKRLDDGVLLIIAAVCSTAAAVLTVIQMFR